MSCLVIACLCEGGGSVPWAQSLAKPHRTVCRTSCPSPLGFRIVKQSPAVLALSLSNEVLYYKWIGQL